MDLFIYDIKGAELVIQKRIIGSTGTAMFAMIDETAGIIKNAVENYFKNRQKILEKAKQEREQLASMTVEERRRAKEERLSRETIRSRYNDSMFLDAHVGQTKQMKIFTYFMQDNMKFSLPSNGIWMENKNTLMNVSLAYGITDDLELKLDLSAILYHYEEHFGFNLADTSKTIYFNPTLCIKWRALQNEKQGINLSILFGIRPALSDTFFTGTIFHPFTFASTHSFYFGLYIDKTIGKFTPFISTEFTIERRYKGNYMYNYLTPKTFKVDELITKHHFTLISKIGFEFRFNSWFIIQPSFIFLFSSKVETMAVLSNPIPVKEYLDNFYQYSPSIKLIFKVSRISAISTSFMYIFSGTLKTDDGDAKVSSSYKIFVHFATAIDL